MGARSIAGTGQVGLGQRFKRIVENSWTNKVFKDDAVETCRSLAQLTIQDFATTQTGKGQYGALVAFPSAKKPRLAEFAIADFNPEQKADYPKLWHVSIGWGQPITDPFLALLREVFWSASQPDTREGIFAVLWALQHAIDCNAGGVNGPARLAVLQGHAGDMKAQLLTDADLAERAYGRVELPCSPFLVWTLRAASTMPPPSVGAVWLVHERRASFPRVREN